MTTFEILIAIYMAAIPPALGALFWSHLNRMETTLNHIAATYVTRDEFNELRSRFIDLRSDVSDIRSGSTGLQGEIGHLRSDVSHLRSELSDQRSDIRGLRSDVTQIALAVGARPRPQRPGAS